MKIGICDDERIWLKKASEIIEKYCEKNNQTVEIVLLHNQRELMRSAQSLDLLFMDIDLEKENGIEIVGKLNSLKLECFIVYLTNYLYYATEVYETKHDYFVLKEQFENKVDAVMNLYEKTKRIEQGKLSFTTIDKMNTEVSVKTIFYLERSARTTKIVTKDKVYTVQTKIEEMEIELSPYEFIRTHKSFMVNPWYVRECGKTTFSMMSGKEIPISRRYEKQSRESFLNWATTHLI